MQQNLLSSVFPMGVSRRGAARQLGRPANHMSGVPGRSLMIRSRPCVAANCGPAPGRDTYAALTEGSEFSGAWLGIHERGAAGLGVAGRARWALTSGFSLTEILVVIAIIAVLAALAFPSLARMRESAHLATCSANLRTLHQATMQFAQDNGGFFPVAKHPQNNYVFALGGTAGGQFATPGYVGLSGSTPAERAAAMQARRRGPSCFWCPATERTQPRSNINTYAMNLYVGGTGSGWPGNPPQPTLRTFQVTTPAKTALYMDGAVRGGGSYTVYVGEAGFVPDPVHPPSIYKETNNPARSVNVVFVDGHVELRRIGTIPTNFSDPFWTATTSL
jgi:prepilin-type N-terminal cleavage/methylation domain-containing protein/prepilin-type processing-associated H-X9-DG protein